MSTENKEIIIKVPDDKRTVRKARRRFGKKGFSNRNSRSRFKARGSFSDSEIKKLRKYCRKKGFWIHITDARYTRSSGYRNDFFRDDPREKYKCAYCGKVLKKEQATVDHILPVRKFRNNRSGILLKSVINLLGIKDINDSRNLAPACQKCNRKKGHNGGFWAFRGFIGKSYFRRTVMNFFKILMVLIVCLALMMSVYAFVFSTDIF